MFTYPAVPVPPRTRSRHYRDLWRSVPRDLAYLLSAFPIALVGFILVVVLFTTGVSLVIVWVGVPILLAAFACARGFGELELRFLRAAGTAPIDRPQWSQRPGSGFWDYVRTVITSPHRWRYLLHVGLVSFVVSLFSWCVALVWSVTAVGGLTHWFWARFTTLGEPDEFWLHTYVFGFFAPGYRPAATFEGLYAAESGMYAVFGLVLLVTLPWVTAALMHLHHSVAKLMLGETRHEVLVRENADLSASRGSAVIAEDHSLRRLERDIHDGPQQRLIRLQFDIASAERKMEADPTAARTLLAGALRQSKETLDELRSLSRGFAPPILQDRGLLAAVESLASRSVVPVTVTFTNEGMPGLAAIERSAYFVIAELLANIDKHAAASTVTVNLEAERESDRDASLVITVTDDGVGGAAAAPEHGLAGLQERVLGLRGTLHIVSPMGGPTRVTARIPFASPLA
jgi:signal transduction histidine kinase